ncbi:MAG: hypothetical protein J6U61_09040, partial [Lachnospiraceae bacterium]|nr:hypothetical protein [Lachnospiraceae bacterium]
EKYLRDNFDKVKDHANAIERRLDDELDLERLINCSREFKEECGEHDIPVLEITDTYDIDELTERALKLIGQ